MAWRRLRSVVLSTCQDNQTKHPEGIIAEIGEDAAILAMLKVEVWDTQSARADLLGHLVGLEAAMRIYDRAK